MKKELHIDKVEIFEWYDGLVLGLAHSGEAGFFACLLAFDADQGHKRYMLASISQEQSSQLKSSFQKEGVQIFSEKLFSKIISESGNLYLSINEPEKEKLIPITTIDDAQRKFINLSFPLIDVAVSPTAIAQWLDK